MSSLAPQQMPCTHKHTIHTCMHTHTHTAKSVWLLCSDNPNIGVRHFALLEDLEKWFSTHPPPFTSNPFAKFLLLPWHLTKFEDYWHFERGEKWAQFHTTELTYSKWWEMEKPCLRPWQIITPASLTLVLLTLSRKRSGHTPHCQYPAVEGKLQ